MNVNESLISKSSVVDTQENKPTLKPRLQCLDVFRGLTMAGMILVDNQGNGKYAIWPFYETDWNGISTADMVFPSFLFINGMSIYLAIKPEMTSDKAAWFKIMKRVFLLFLIGFLLNLQVKNFNIFKVRIMGVLQRISLCYLVIVLIRLLVPKHSHQLMIMSFFPALYISLMYGVDVPGCGKGNLTPTCNFGSYIDTKIWGPNHMLKYNDPEGYEISNNFGCNLQYLHGIIIYDDFLKRQRLANLTYQKLAYFIKLLNSYEFIGIDCKKISLSNHKWTPYNKKLWSPSFTLLTSGISGISLLFCYLFVDFYKSRIGEKLKWPMIWLGMNPLFVFVAMIFWEALLMWNIKFDWEGSKISLWLWINNELFLSWMHYQWLATTTVSILYLIIWSWIAKILYDRKIFIKL